MSTITLPFVFTNGQQLPAGQLNSDFSTIYTDYNGNITNVNISSTAGISLSKLNLTTTPGQAIILTVSGTNTWGAGITGDANPRVTMTTDGAIGLGAGTTNAPDTFFQRTAANVVAVASTFGGTTYGSFTGLDSKSILGGGSNTRQLPTTGVINGEYWHNGNWTQTGPITSQGARIHVTGNMVINNTWGISVEFGGGNAGPTVTAGNGAGCDGQGFTPGHGAPSNSVGVAGGGGAAHGGGGGSGGAVANINPNWGVTVASSSVQQLPLAGSGGGGGVSATNSGGAGGSGGGSLYVECTGNVTMTSAASMTANGTAGSIGGTTTGSGGGGAGGGIMFRVLGTFTGPGGGTIVMTVNGGAGGNAPTTGAAGGGGGGGIIDISAISFTGFVLGTNCTAVLGAAGTGGVTAAVAGSTGIITLNAFTQLVRSSN